MRKAKLNQYAHLKWPPEGYTDWPYYIVFDDYMYRIDGVDDLGFLKAVYEAGEHEGMKEASRLMQSRKKFETAMGGSYKRYAANEGNVTLQPNLRDVYGKEVDHD